MAAIVSALRTVIQQGFGVDMFLHAATIDIMKRGTAARIRQALMQAELDLGEDDRANGELMRALGKLDSICRNIILFTP